MTQVYGAGARTLPKSGRLATGSYHGVGNAPIPGSPFPGHQDWRPLNQMRGSGLAGGDGGSVIMPDNRISGTNNKNENPIGTRRNIATIKIKGAAQTQAGTNNTQLVSNQPGLHKTRTNIILMPHEKPMWFLRKPQPITKTQFGASHAVKSDTPFHPIAKHVYHPPMNHTPVTGERTHAGSFHTHNNVWQDPHNSFVHGHQSVATRTVGAGRWQVVKRGAAG